MLTSRKIHRIIWSSTDLRVTAEAAQATLAYTPKAAIIFLEARDKRHLPKPKERLYSSPTSAISG